MAGLVRSRTIQYNPVPAPGGMTGEQSASVYQGFYGEMPVPATHFATSTAALKAVEVVPSVRTRAANASVVRRVDRMKGYTPTEGRNSYGTAVPPMYQSPYSSKYQDELVGPLINYVQNLQLYRAGYPAASVMNGGLHNLALSTKVDQLVTRSTGGPGPGFMRPQPRFGRVQNVPRFATRPQQYPTQSAPG